eukprot:m51a1_g7621 hypothetical protein (650) ;mRNA; f:295642-297829
MEQLFWTRVSECERGVLVMGCGGGYDVFCGLPLMLELERRARHVHLASLTFSDVHHLSGARIDVPGASTESALIVEVTPDTRLADPSAFDADDVPQEAVDAFAQACELESKGDIEGATRLYRRAARLGHSLRGDLHKSPLATPGGYCPEYRLSRWFRAQHGREVPVYAVRRGGVPDVARALEVLAERLDVGAVVLVDGGTDSLCVGDEDDVGTPAEDATSVAAVWRMRNVSDGAKFLVATALGVELTVAHSLVLENIAALAHTGAFLGSQSLVAGTPGEQALRSAHQFAWDESGHPSIVCSSLLAGAEGQFGDYHATERTRGSQLCITPLMAVYWFFALSGVTGRMAYLPLIQETRSLAETSLAIARYRHSLGEAALRRRRVVFDDPSGAPLARCSEHDAEMDASCLVSVSAALGREGVCASGAVVLVEAGSFNPPHLGHVRALEVAAQHLSAECGMTVVGAFLAPAHDSYLARKIRDATQRVPGPVRVRMCQLAADDNNARNPQRGWSVGVDAWEASSDAERSPEEVARHLHGLVLAATGRDVRVAYVCGADVAPGVAGMFDSAQGKFLVCAVPRSGSWGSDSKQLEGLKERHPSAFHVAGGEEAAAHGAIAEASSSDARSALRAPCGVPATLAQPVLELINRMALYK